MGDIKNLAQLCLSLLEIYKSKPLFTFRNNDIWVDMYAEEALDRIFNIAFSLNKIGFQKGDKLCLMCETRYEWFLFDFAMACLGIVSVPIYPTLTGEQAKYIIKHSDARGIIVSTKDLLKLILQYKNELNLIKYILIEGDINKEADSISFNDLEKIGITHRKEKKDEYLLNIINNIKEDELASILYTSGTTGTQKGVMLSHKNFLSNAYGALHKLNLDRFNTILLFLPLSHSFSRTCTYGMMLGGVHLWYAEKIATIARDLIESHTDAIITVPRVFENVYRKIINNAKEGGWLKFKIFNWVKKIANKYVEKKQNKKRLSFLLKFKYKIADKLVFHKIREKVGGNIKLVVSGASTLSKQISYFFNGAGIEIVEGYGLTEATPIVSTNQPGDKNRIGTVGTTFEFVDVKLGDGNELMVRGPNVMMGYYKNEEATKEVITEDGWLKTGDIAEISDDGYIKIIERKKDLYKTSAGKYIVPQKIENMAKLSPFIDDFIVIADNRKYASALIIPNFEELIKYANKNDIKFKDNKDLINNKHIYDLYRKVIKEVINTKLAMYENIKKFVLLHEPLSINNGTLTPTMKVKRKEVYRKYKNLIEGLYK